MIYHIDSKPLFTQLVCCTHAFINNFATAQMRIQLAQSWLQLAPEKNLETRTDFTSDHNNMPYEGIKTAGKKQSVLN